MSLILCLDFKIRYEALKSNTKSEINKLTNSLNLNFTEKEIEKAIYFNSSRIIREQAEKENNTKIMNFISNGNVNRWVKEYDNEMKAVFKINKKWNDLLFDLGYETNKDW